MRLNASIKLEVQAEWPLTTIEPQQELSMKFMLTTVLLGVAIAAATLTSVGPASALGGCGRNYHRNAFGLVRLGRPG